jgi:tRNA pseudouridine55 synthase
MREKWVWSGWLIIDKPSGITSMDVLRKIRKALGVKKIGHAGTLDPLATGVLPVALREATKTIPYSMEAEKEYDFTVQWGFETDTEDSLGTITTKIDKTPSLEEIEKVLPGFLGITEQMPPRFSALKVQGKRAYDLARSGIDFELNKRSIDIKELRVFPSISPGAHRFIVRCSKGTYVRSLARDIGRALGAAGHLIALRRLKVGSFLIDNAILLDNFLEYVHTYSMHQVVQQYVRALHAVLDDIPAVVVSEFQEFQLRQGREVSYEYPLGTHIKKVCCVTEENTPVGIARREDSYGKTQLFPERIFNK